jgi:hypothetical protein
VSGLRTILLGARELDRSTFFYSDDPGPLLGFRGIEVS